MGVRSKLVDRVLVLDALGGSLARLLVVLILALDLFIKKASVLLRQIIDSLNLLLWVIVQVELYKITCGHTVDL